MVQGKGLAIFIPRAWRRLGDGTVYVADVRNHVIRRVYWSGWAETLAGSAGKPGLVDGEQSAARFYNPSAVAVGPEGEVYVADSGNHAVRRVSPAGVVTTLFAGRSYVTAEMRMGAKAPLGLWNPCGIAAWATAAGTLRLVVADTDNHRILWLTPPGVTPVQGGGGGGDGSGATRSARASVCIGRLGRRGGGGCDGRRRQRRRHGRWRRWDGFCRWHRCSRRWWRFGWHGDQRRRWERQHS